jgi:hypothetical protein
MLLSQKIVVNGDQIKIQKQLEIDYLFIYYQKSTGYYEFRPVCEIAMTWSIFLPGMR